MFLNSRFLSPCVRSGSGVDQLLLQSGGTEPAGGAAEGWALEGLRPPPDGGRESGRGAGGGGPDEQRDSGRSPGRPAASADQVRFYVSPPSNIVCSCVLFVKVQLI